MCCPVALIVWVQFSAPPTPRLSRTPCLAQHCLSSQEINECITFVGIIFLISFSLIVYTCIPKQHSLVLPVFKLHMSRIILYIFCYVWSLVLLRYIHADCVCVIGSSLFIFHCWMVFHCINISQYIDPFLLLDIWVVSNLGLLQKIKL